MSFLNLEEPVVNIRGVGILKTYRHSRMMTMVCIKGRHANSSMICRVIGELCQR